MTTPNQTISSAENKASSSLAKLEYPLDSGNEERLVKFSIRQYNKGKVDAKEKENIIAAIHMPMPENLQDSLNHTYDTFSGGGADRIINSIKNSSSQNAGSVLEAIGKEGLYMGANALLQTLSSKGGSMGNLGKILQREAGGIAINPRTSIFFSNTDLKLYSFEYLMIARNEEESISIDNIVKRFQYHSLPNTFDNGNGLVHPEFFVISFLAKGSNNAYTPSEFLPIPNPCVLKQIAVSYNENSSPIFYHQTGAPVAVRLSLQFQEIEIETKTSFESKYTKFASSTK